MPKYSFSSRQVQSLLDGFVCLFKPRDVSVSALENLFLKTVCKQANELDPDRPLPPIEMPIVESMESGSLAIVGKRHQIDYSMHPLIVGRMFRPEDFQMESLNYLEPSSSGICLFGLNSSCSQLEQIREQAWLNEYILEGELGLERYGHTIRGKMNLRMEYDHVTQHRMNTVLSTIRMLYKRTAFEFANVDLQSQEAFELARRGAPRPRVLGSPLLYGIELLHFKPPIFKVRIQATGETNQFLRELIHQIGCSLDTTASPRRLRRVQQGCFGLEHALLDKHLYLETVVKNMLMSGKMVEKAMTSASPPVLELKEGEELEEEGKTMLKRYRLGPRDVETDELAEVEDCLRLPFGRNYSIC